MKKSLRLLHTSDWHLGRPLYGRRRYAEFESFLDWLLETIEEQEIDILAIAGDVFDTTTPSPGAQALYYNFLARAAASKSCRHVVIIAGNHDSPALLKAPGDLLKALNIHVVGTVSKEAEDELICLKDSDGQVEAIVCAVPYPRDRDIRESAAGESLADKENKLVENIRRHYALLAAKAESRLMKLWPMRPPVIALGHLFAAGGRTVDGDGTRSLYVGSLGQVPADAFPDVFDYVALGHLHQPQLVGANETRRYCGAPLPMTFAESARAKQVSVVDFSTDTVKVSAIEIPVFQRLKKLAGDWAAIKKSVEELNAEECSVWLEIEYNGDELIPDLREKLAEIASDKLEILKVSNSNFYQAALRGLDAFESLESLDEREVFLRLLDLRQVPEEQRGELWGAYDEVLRQLHENEDEER